MWGHLCLLPRPSIICRAALAGLSIAGTLAAGTAEATGHSLRDEEPAPLMIPTADDNSRSEDAPCFAVDAIRIEGQHDLVDQAALEAAARPFASSCQGNESVGALLKALSAVYVDRGYVTTQAFLPEQDIAKSQKLVVRVVAGRIDKIIYREERKPYRGPFPRMTSLGAELVGSHSLNEFTERMAAWWDGLDDDLDALTLLPASVRIALARTTKADDVVHVDQLQDTLDSLNRVPSSKAKADLTPGGRPATSHVQITNRIEDAFRLYAGYDTESIEGVDKLRFGVTVQKDNLVGINDSWGLTLKSGIDTNELAGDVSVPLGRATLRARGDWSENTADLGPLSELFTATWNVGLGADYIVHASRKQRLAADMTFTHREQNRYINGIGLTDQRVSALQAGLTYSRFFEHGALSARIASTVGVPTFHARIDPDDLGRQTPHSQFAKLEGSFSGSYVMPGKASFSSSLSGQWSADPLYSDDQLTIGSRASVRGFSNGSLKADSGLIWRNEVAFALPISLTGSSGENADNAQTVDPVSAVLSHINPYTFLDAGFGHDIANDANGYRIGAGIGVRYGGPSLSFDAGYALRLLSEPGSRQEGDAPGELFVTLRMKVF
ncbi:ShlB/FhaC/HecB family hemolysin secretion/activation protein [Nitratireductor sp. PBL-C9]|uniref:ShlB/FhaC/HecB family hemolysin secretion/activation protein n=1 Tax=Nitratireductor sp. PBL-C9 TaxID=3435013 RepID=UPI003D7DC5E1